MRISNYIKMDILNMNYKIMLLEQLEENIRFSLIIRVKTFERGSVEELLLSNNLHITIIIDLQSPL